MSRALRRGRSKVWGDIARVGVPFPDLAHQEEHLPRLLVYTSATTIPTTASAPIYPPRGGRITAVHLNVNGTAPSGSALTCDVLIGGTSIFASDLPSIATGEYTSGTSGTGNLLFDPRIAGDNGAVFRAFEKIQVQCTAVNSAAGPLVVQLEIDWEQ